MRPEAVQIRMIPVNVKRGSPRFILEFSAVRTIDPIAYNNFCCPALDFFLLSKLWTYFSNKVENKKEFIDYLFIPTPP